MLISNNLMGANDGGASTRSAGTNSATRTVRPNVEMTDPNNSFLDGILDYFGLGSPGRNREFEANEAQVNRMFQQNSANTAMEFEKEEAQKNRDFQERMARNSYQYAVEDLKAAGLNPILAATNGGAATPSGSTATGKTAPGSQAKGSESGVGKGIELVTAITGSAKDISKLLTKSFTMGFGA